MPSDPVHVITVDPSLEKPPDYSTVVDVPPCYEEAIKLSNSASKVVAVHTLKHITTTMTSNETAIDVSGKIPETAATNRPTERNNSSQFANQACDHPEILAQVTANERRASEKCDPEISQNSSQNENTLAKVLRKSIRGIRRLRNGGDENTENPSNDPTCTLESGLTERITTETDTKVER